MLSTAEDALQSAVDSRLSLIQPRIQPFQPPVEDKFREAVDILSIFVKDFPLKDSMSDPNIGGTVTGKVKMSDKSKSPTTILQALKNSLNSRVKFLSVSLSFNADGSQPLVFTSLPRDQRNERILRRIAFHLLSSPHDPNPIIVTRACHAIYFSPVSDSCARCPQ